MLARCSRVLLRLRLLGLERLGAAGFVRAIQAINATVRNGYFAASVFGALAFSAVAALRSLPCWRTPTAPSWRADLGPGVLRAGDPVKGVRTFGRLLWPAKPTWSPPSAWPCRRPCPGSRPTEVGVRLTRLHLDGTMERAHKEEVARYRL